MVLTCQINDRPAFKFEKEEMMNILEKEYFVSKNTLALLDGFSENADVHSSICVYSGEKQSVCILLRKESA